MTERSECATLDTISNNHLILRHHRYVLDTQSPSPQCVRNEGCLTRVASWRTQAIACVYQSYGCSLNAEGPASRLSGQCVPTELALPLICMVVLQESKSDHFLKPRELFESRSAIAGL